MPGKKPRYPDLQQKFELALRHVLSMRRSPLGTPEIVQQIRQSREEFEISLEEMEFLARGPSNFLVRAEDNEVVQALGRRQGYELVSLQHAPPAEAESSDRRDLRGDTFVEVDAGVRRNQQWESLAHFIATAALLTDRTIGGEIVSFPAKGTSVKWANPDILVIRESGLSVALRDLYRFRNSASTSIAYEEAREILPRFSNESSLVSASFELKWDLRNSRSRLFEAITEAAANSHWANESWLLWLDRDGGAALDPQALDLARTTGVGLAQLFLHGTGTNRTGDSGIYVHLPAQQRASLSLQRHHIENTALLSGLSECVARLDDSDAYVHLDVDAAKIVRILSDSIANLSQQTGFGSDWLKTMRKHFELDRALVSSMAHSYLLTLFAAVKRDSLKETELTSQYLDQVALTGPERQQLLELLQFLYVCQQYHLSAIAAPNGQGTPAAQPTNN